MIVNEIFLSIQGEGAGFPTVFVRFTGCNLRCNYCDTKYAYHEGKEMSVSDILKKISSYKYKRVCLTGGEPLLQSETKELLKMLKGYNVSIETNGSVSLKNYHMMEGHYFVMDMKAPSSGCSGSMILENFQYLNERDEIKFVIGDKADYEWAKNIINKYYKKGIIIISPVFGMIEYKNIVNWILEDKLDVRFQLQMHKLIWGEAEGV